MTLLRAAAITSMLAGLALLLYATATTLPLP